MKCAIISIAAASLMAMPDLRTASTARLVAVVAKTVMSKLKTVGSRTGEGE